MLTKPPIERVVTILTPLFAVAAGWVSTVIAQVIPGVTIPQDQIVAFFVAGSTAAAAAAIHWLHGRQQFVAFTDQAKSTLDDAVKKVEAALAASPQASLALGDIEGLLKSHEAQIEQTIDAHVPTAVGQALQGLFSQLGQPAPVVPAPVAPAAPPVQ
jgi:hypothetical protein